MGGLNPLVSGFTPHETWALCSNSNGCRPNSTHRNCLHPTRAAITPHPRRMDKGVPQMMERGCTHTPSRGYSAEGGLLAW